MWGGCSPSPREGRALVMQRKEIKAVYFDMDGTIADLYGVADWLPRLMAEDPTPYKVAAPMQPMGELDELARELEREGVEVGIISWAAKGSTRAYEMAVEREKRQWAAKYLPSIRNVAVVPYGTPKAQAARISRGAVLVDDDERVREQWDNEREGRASIEPQKCVEFMRELVRTLRG